MPVLPSNRAGIEALPLPERNAIDYRDTKQRALWLRVSPAGTKSWCVRYKRKGKSQRENIGRFPELPISLAREEAAKVLGALAAGTDLIGDKKAAKITEARQALDTIAAIGERYLIEAAAGRHRMNGKPMRASSMSIERAYFAIIRSKFGRSRIADLTRAEIQSFVNDLAETKSAGAARHSRNVLKRIYAFAFWQDIVTTDPMRFVSAPTWNERERILNDDELRAVWQAVGNVGAITGVSISPALGLAVKIAAVTLQRRGEVVGMRLDEIDRAARTWTMAGERTKNGRTHVVPLSDIALSLIDEAIGLRAGRSRESEFVFSSRVKPDEPIAANAVSHAWRRLLPHIMIPAPTAKDPERKKAATNITVHDLRRTGATAITSERIGIARFVVSRVLNHTSDNGGTAAVTAVYDRNAYMREKRAALDAWAALLLEIVEARSARKYFQENECSVHTSVGRCAICDAATFNDNSK